MILSRLQNIDLKYRISLLFFKCWHNHSGSGLVCCQYLSSASFSSHSFQGVCKGVRHGALTTSQFFPVARSGDNFVILASLHLLCTWKLVLLLFVGFFSEIPFKVCHLIHGTSVSLVLLFSLAEIFSPQVNLNHCSRVRSFVCYQNLTRTHLPGCLPILPKGC